MGSCWINLATGGGAYYIGPDHSTPLGAERLAVRIRKYWDLRGVAYDCEPYLVRGRNDQVEGAVFGVRGLASRPIPQVPPKKIIPNIFPVGPTPRARIYAFIRSILAARHPDVTLDDVLGKNAHAYIVAARYECVQAVRDEFNPVLERLGAIFNRDHGTIMYALGWRRKPERLAA